MISDPENFSIKHSKHRSITEYLFYLANKSWYFHQVETGYAYCITLLLKYNHARKRTVQELCYFIGIYELKSQAKSL